MSSISDKPELAPIDIAFAKRVENETPGIARTLRQVARRIISFVR